MVPSVDRVAAVPVASDLSVVPVARACPAAPVVPAPVVASDGRCVVEFMVPGVVASRAVVLGVWPCIGPVL